MQLQTLLAASIICQLQTLETIHLFITEMYIKKENLSYIYQNLKS